MRPIDADALISEIKKDTEKAIEQDDCNGSFWLGYIAGLVIKQPTVQPEPTDIDAREAVYNLAEKIGIHQLFALTVELRGEPIQPEPHEGEWEQVSAQRYFMSASYFYRCSACGVNNVRNTNYCPHCGAKMKGERQK